MTFKLGEGLSAGKSDTAIFEKIINEKKKYKIDDLRGWVKRKYTILKQVETGTGCVGNYFKNEKELDEFLNNNMPEIVDFESMKLKEQEEWIKKAEEFINISKLYLMGNTTLQEQIMIREEEIYCEQLMERNKTYIIEPKNK